MAAEIKEYTGSVYLGVVGGDIEHGPCRDSIERIAKRHGDSYLNFTRATKGFTSRQEHINNFIKSKYDFLLLLDHDQTFPEDTLERLRSHKLPYISGFYMRRLTHIFAPVWYRPWNGQFPMEPWVGKVERGRLHKLGASGWGCMLIYRDVIVAVRALLKGEWEVLEDDMDIYPYDLRRIVGALNGMQEILDTKTATLGDEARWVRTIPVQAYLNILKEEIRPLRCDRDIIGSDIRFPFFALEAGFELWGDPDVRCGHIIHYPLGADDYERISDADFEVAQKKQQEYVASERLKIQTQIGEVINA